MKKRKWMLVAVALIATGSIAFGQTKPKAEPQQKPQTCFVDANADGVCDKFESGECTTCLGKGQGLRNGNRSKLGQGRGMKAGQGMRAGRGGKARGLRGAGQYVDANNNGVCDYREPAKVSNP